MPQFTARTVLQFCLLLSAIPAQYFISKWYGTDLTERLQVTESYSPPRRRPHLITWCCWISSYLRSFDKSYLNQAVWIDQVNLWKLKVRSWFTEDLPKAIGNNPSMEEKEAHTYFAESQKIRSPKPSFVKYGVGQVIIHRRRGYSGVIVGWDEEARAPEEWLRKKYGKDSEALRSTPHYRVLINRVNKNDISIEYISEEDIKIITGLQVHHPDLKLYFKKYDGSKYIMQPWLKEIYPHDS